MAEEPALIEEAARELARGGRVREAFARMAGLMGFDERAVAEGLRADFEASGTIDAIFVTQRLPRARVAALLPRGLQPAPQAVVPFPEHPIVVACSHYRFSAWFGDMDYHEVMIAVPFVERTDTHVPNRGPFLYMPRLYLDAALPCRLGNMLYGYEKVRAEIDVGDGAWHVHDERGRTLLRLHAQARGAEIEPRAMPGLPSLRRLLELPTVSQTLRIADAQASSRQAFESAFLASNIFYGFDDETARVQAVDAELEIGPGFVTHGDAAGRHTSAGIDRAELGAVRLRAPVRVSMPQSCASIRWPASAPAQRRRVVVVGGGPAGCAAAYWLARQPERYEVSLYTSGWRLGGKCASGRNADRYFRLEEHGLHAFLGFYENAFRTVREVWQTAELTIDGDEPLDRAFIGKLDVGLLDRHRGAWRYFPTGQRRNAVLPGTVPTEESDRIPGLGELVLALVDRVQDELRDADGPVATGEPEADASWWERGLELVDRALGLRPGALDDVFDTLVARVRELALEEFAELLERGHPMLEALAWALEAVRSRLRGRESADPEVWFRWSNLDIVTTIAIGVLRSRAARFAELDDRDFRAWLIEHGLHPDNRDVSAVRMVYDTMFANSDDVPLRGEQLGCGVALRWFLLTGFGYRGFPAYDFRYGCAQTLFTPYWLALRRLGVKVHFFHRLEELEVERKGGDRALTGLRLRRQTTVIAGPDAYEPLLDHVPGRDPPGLPDWPATPHWEQLAEGDHLRGAGIDLEDIYAEGRDAVDVALERGRDFDEVVLAVPLGALRGPARSLSEPSSPVFDAAWARMIESTSTVATASFQLWFSQPVRTADSSPELCSGYLPPWTSLGNFSHLLPHEGWPDDFRPRHLVYHTGAGLALRGVLPRVDQRVEIVRESDLMVAWLRDNWRGIYGGFATWDELLAALHAPADLSGEDRLRWQYFTVRLHPSDRYVLSRPGELALRKAPGESGVRGLVLAGDWTRTALDCGCVEAATQSGMLAARVLSDEPRYVWHPGF